MHDYFEILGVARDARAPEIRRACCRRSRRSHPDVWDGESGSAFVDTIAQGFARSRGQSATLADAAIDFVDMAPLIERMRAAFFCVLPS